MVDFWGHTVRKITPSAIVATLGGSPDTPGNTDGTDSSARFNQTFGVAVSGSYVLVADYSGHVIRKGTPALPDKRVVDVPVGLMGTARQQDVTNPNNRCWSWTMIRHPANSDAELSSGSAHNPTFTPDVSDLYVIRPEGKNSSGRVVSGQWQY